MKINPLIEKIERNHHIIMLLILLLMLLSPLAYSQTPCNTELNETHSNVSCFGNQNGSINISTAVPNGSLNYLWSDGNTNKDRTNLAPGTYTVTATDGEYCNASLSVIITEPTELLVAESHQASTCGGVLNNIIISASGGQAPYSYLWSDGDTNDERAQLIGGVFTVTVSDANSCTKQLSLSNNNNVTFQCKIVKQTTISCYGNCDGALKVDAIFSTPPFSYQWNNGATTNIISNVCIGTYTVTVTNGMGCTAKHSMFLCSPNKLAAPYTKTEITTPGANDGSITWSTKGGTKPYYFLWSDGYAAANRSNVVAGKYTITVTDAHGCTAVKKITWKNPVVQRTIADASVDMTEGELSVAPNPSVDQFEIDFDVIRNSEYTLSVIDADGRIIINSKYEWSEGHQQLMIDLAQKPKGIYTLFISNTERRLIKKLVLL